MDQLFKITKIVIIIILVIVVMMAAGIVGIKKLSVIKKPELEKIEYRTDTEHLTKRFGNFIKIENCFWKAGMIGRSNIGPSSYWLKGYAFITQENADFIKNEYSFTNVDIQFDDGITPDITGKNEFGWSYNKELSKKIAGAGFIGEFYFDIINNIFYFDLESN